MPPAAWIAAGTEPPAAGALLGALGALTGALPGALTGALADALPGVPAGVLAGAELAGLTAATPGADDDALELEPAPALELAADVV
ncbi:hypothetical protein [Nakamurella sp. PAMC28650]|uniref:hypothetical protein n=1 Tax=Nakamurella sp. PAMC28650 TaxID=2762325 RepID=UPI00164EB1DC|nr:hypothetical protein [Nakamurella sp. PAMC28650]QNK82223.1 hypothetical protein H7F38_05620 [Nakamurella sp. PAMC28650]